MANETLPVLRPGCTGLSGAAPKAKDAATKCSGATAETKLYCSEQANEATQAFSIGAIATAEGLLIGH